MFEIRELGNGTAGRDGRLGGLGHTARPCRALRVDFQNENLIARELVEGRRVVLGCVPDLLCLLETEGVSYFALHLQP